MDPLYQHDIEAVLKELILRKLTISPSKRVQRSGKLIVYHITNHNIELVLGNPRDPRSHSTCLIPYPFQFSHDRDNKRVTFNYDVSSLLPHIQTSTLTSPYKPNKILNNTFAISYE